MNRFKNFLSGLTLALALPLAACGGATEPLTSPATSPGPAPVTSAAAPTASATSAPTSSAAAPASASPADSLAALRALNVIDVGGLINDVPAEAMQCYGPCPGYEDAIAEARARSQQRLASLAAVARSLPPAAADPQTCEPAAIETNLNALRNLRIVEVKRFMAVQPKASSHCYSEVCPEDRERARAQTCERAATLASLANRAQGL